MSDEASEPSNTESKPLPAPVQWMVSFVLYFVIFGTAAFVAFHIRLDGNAPDRAFLAALWIATPLALLFACIPRTRRPWAALQAIGLFGS